jgi:signal transduction histidine kinase
MDDSRARKVIDELDNITHVVEQLTQLARLENLAGSALASVELEKIASATTAHLAPYVYSKSHTIEYADLGSPAIEAVPAILEIMISNLIENAVRHTPPGTHIVVQSGPGAEFSVLDQWPSGKERQRAEFTADASADQIRKLGIGLQIVERIARFHRATVAVDAVPGKSTRVTVRFAAAHPEIGKPGAGPVANN